MTLNGVMWVGNRDLYIPPYADNVATLAKLRTVEHVAKIR
jgi:hypothetical protein